MSLVKLHKTVGVKVGRVQVGGGAPIVVQSMTMTETADAAATAQQCIELAEAGSEMVRITVNVPEAAAAVPEIKQRMLDAGCEAPLIGDFHYNGHLLLTRYPDCARAPDRPAAASRLDRGGNGDEGARLVGVRDGRAAERRHRRHDSRVAHAAARRRPARRGLRRVRAAAGARPSLVFAERHRVSRMR